MMHNETLHSTHNEKAASKPFKQDVSICKTPPLSGEEILPCLKDKPASFVDTNKNNDLILVVDDEEPIREVVKLSLERKGYRVLTAVNGKEALVTYQGHRGDIKLVLMDLSMPVMDGETAMHVLRTINPKVKIICASSLCLQRNLKDDTGVDDLYFLPKPYSINSLLQAVQAVLIAND